MVALSCRTGRKHRLLDRQIEEAFKASDDAKIRQLKAEKLKLKDEMERLGKQTRH